MTSNRYSDPYLKPLAMIKPNGTKVALPDAICIKYGLRPGSVAPFSGLPIVELNRKLTPEEIEADERAAAMQELARTLRDEERTAPSAKKTSKRRTTRKSTATKKAVAKKTTRTAATRAKKKTASVA